MNGIIFDGKRQQRSSVDLIPGLAELLSAPKAQSSFIEPSRLKAGSGVFLSEIVFEQRF
ncbi:hypothetical protein V6R98_28410 [Agrobacterium sp. CCNWLW71]|uniref:hypothetical protein n=1 Tax=unclassified Agrobacterium TaxID=2632611 RepID=UPI002FF16B1C